MQTRSPDYYTPAALSRLNLSRGRNGARRGTQVMPYLRLLAMVDAVLLLVACSVPSGVSYDELVEANLRWDRCVHALSVLARRPAPKS